MDNAVSPLNSQALTAIVVTNLLGIRNQAMFGVQSLVALTSITLGWVIPLFPYNYPSVANGSTHINKAYYIEATLYGALLS